MQTQHQDYLRARAATQAEIFVEPSREARFLLKNFGWLVSPTDERGSLLSRLIRSAMVAPFTQMTFFSFDLQAFLFQIFHQTKVSRFGHFTFMIAVNFFLMVGLNGVYTTTLEVGGSTLHIGAGTAYAALLAAWYIAMAVITKMHAWMLVSIPVVVGLYAASQVYATTFFVDGGTWLQPTDLLANPWLLMWASAFLIALSHAPEPKLPPRAGDEMEWKSVPDFVLGQGQRNNPLRMLVNGIRTGLFLVWGTLDEWWASPRLMPYNFLMLMFEAGYKPDTYAELKRRADTALASGNPAIDYVGVGGGTFMKIPEAV